MALIRCTECGHQISDRASACPNCGCPIENKLNLQSETIVTNNRKKTKLLLWLSLALAICIVVGGLFYAFKKSNSFKNKEAAIELNDTTKNTVKGEYTIILYNDNVGEFYNPRGGRICSFVLNNGRKEPLQLNLSQSISIMGRSSDKLYITGNRLFADYMDYVNYNSNYNPDKSLGVAVQKKETDNGICFIVDLDSSKIEQKEIPIHQIKASADKDYTMLYYNDEYGILFDNKGQRLCGVSKGTTVSGDMKVNLSKPISIYGVTTSELSMKGDNLYTSNRDLIDDSFKRDGEPSKKVASIKRTEEKDVTIFAFSKVSEKKASVRKNLPEKKDGENSYTSRQTNSSKWDIASAEELRRKISGTIWTCRPIGRTWYRLVFSSTYMTLYYAEPQMGRWIGGEDNDKWDYTIKESYTSDTGEKCISVQFYKPGDETLSYGALFFLKGGRVEFSWLRGRYGGKVECKDFHWQ